VASRRTPDNPRAADAKPAAAARRTLTTKKTASALHAAVTAEARHAMIAESAYLRAERRGFTPGREAEDWLAAEVEVDALLRVSSGGSPQ
jgi:Protein of unknown function (DUF2934)